jgi:purine-nucleoside phosphorylase
MSTVVLPVQVMRCLGVRMVVVTNAAGGLKDTYNVGDVAIIRDHIALPLLCGKNPLVGINDDELGPRFPPTSNLYDIQLQQIVMEVAKSMNFDKYLHTNGTYAFVSGPQYESKSECAMLRMLGADAVGMSTVPEILAAHHSGMAVLCLSLITNKVVYYDEDDDNDDDDKNDGEKKKKKVEHANHAEVLTAVQGRGAQMVQLVGEVVKKCDEVYLPKLDELNPICLETKGRVRGGGVDGEEKNSTKTMMNMLCPYHLVKGILSAPAHCMVLGGSILAAGVVMGMKMSSKR